MPGKNKQVYKAIAAPPMRTRNLAVWLDQHGQKHTELAGPALIHQPLELARRAREPVQYKQQLHRHGKYWFAQLGHHVWHESMFEKHALTFLDFLGNVSHVIAQPCLLVFDDGTYHYPDYFVVHDDGSRALLDVHFEQLITDKTMRTFANTKKVCDAIGWKYETFTHGLASRRGQKQATANRRAAQADQPRKRTHWMSERDRGHLPATIAETRPDRQNDKSADPQITLIYLDTAGIRRSDSIPVIDSSQLAEICQSS
ncbi:hypothetical protein [Leifsonia sp. WHRI 6310E]|uniref:hypothetical protein n=1 Tax=Leifsonia sp. WHRI 6310E TaxID=3162562 RepID=UPI0032EF2EDC